MPYSTITQSNVNANVCGVACDLAIDCAQRTQCPYNYNKTL